jgi:hypothetical protein
LGKAVSIFTKKEKEAKRKKHAKGEACGNCRNYGKKQNAALLFPTVAWISRATNVRGYPQLRTGPTAVNKTAETKNQGPRIHLKQPGFWS